LLFSISVDSWQTETTVNNGTRYNKIRSTSSGLTKLCCNGLCIWGNGAAAGYNDSELYKFLVSYTTITRPTALVRGWDFINKFHGQPIILLIQLCKVALSSLLKSYFQPSRQLLVVVHFIKHDIQGVFLKCAEILPTRLFDNVED
jgi:hypothetical protein